MTDIIIFHHLSKEVTLVAILKKGIFSPGILLFGLSGSTQERPGKISNEGTGAG